jgi:type II secretory pathway component PulF
MPTFEYKAKTRTGEVVSGSVAAGDKRQALAQLGRMGYFPMSVETSSAKTPRGKTGTQLKARVSRREVLMFTQQLSTLLRAGMALSQALTTLEKRTQSKGMKPVLAQIRGDIVSGVGLSESMARFPKVFSRFYVNLVRSGEASGTLDEVLVRLKLHQERMAEIREKVVGALIYPLVIMGAGVAVIVFFMTVMVPRFATMFKEMGRTMPLPTRILIGVSDAFVSYWWVGVLLIALAVGLYMQQVRTEKGRLIIDRAKMRLPILGSVIRANAFAQFARTLATLLENGVPVLAALQIVEDTMTNRVIANEIRQARTRVTDGTSISQPLAKGNIFPPLLIDMLAVGEESGDVANSLKNIADTYEQELTQTLKVMVTLLEPAIIIFMATVVGGIVLSVLLAVFDITSGIGK